MSDWTPKVGDRVLVGQTGPYRVEDTKGDDGGVLIAVPLTTRAWWVERAWLTPAPEPEPEEPPAPGALVRDGNGALRTLYVDLNARRWYLTRGGLGVGLDWPDLPRPITVILADPAEVETLRADLAETKRLLDVARGNAEARLQSAMHATERADELQQRIEKVVARGPGWIMQHGTAVMCILQGES